MGAVEVGIIGGGQLAQDDGVISVEKPRREQLRPNSLGRSLNIAMGEDKKRVQCGVSVISAVPKTEEVPPCRL